jgi:hypothetical protein
MAKTSVKDKLDIQVLSIPSAENTGEVTKHPVTSQLLVAKETNWEPLRINDIDNAPFSRYYVYPSNAIGSHTSPRVNDLVYDDTLHRLYRYCGDGTNHVWQEADWKKLVVSSTDYVGNRLRYTNGYLEVSPNGSAWYKVYPLVGANVIRIETYDNSAYSRIYWLGVGVTANISGANHLPIAFAKDVQPSYKIFSMSNTSYELWVGLRPNNLTVSDGDGQYLSGTNTTAGANRNTALNIFPLTELSSAGTAENRFEGSIYFAPTNRMLSNSLGLGFGSYVVTVTNGSATITATTYWMGTWYRQDNVQFAPALTSITRVY